MNLREDIDQSSQSELPDINEMIAYGRQLRSEYMAQQARRLGRFLRSIVAGRQRRDDDVRGTAAAG